MHKYSRYLLAFAALTLSSAAQAQSSMGLGLGIDAVRASGGALLDNMAPSAAAYSFRKLRSAYTGSAVQLRRASDSTVLDIGFVGNDFNTAAAVTFCNATSCFIGIWYDQSGNARNAVQSTLANQPALIFSCAGTLPCMRLTAATQQIFASVGIVSAASLSLNAVARQQVAGAAGCWFAYTSGNYLLHDTATGTLFLYNGAASISAPDVLGALHSQSGVMNGAGSVLNVDGGEVSGSITTATPGDGLIGIKGDTGICDQGEMIAWNGYALTAADRAKLTANQQNYWGLNSPFVNAGLNFDFQGGQYLQQGQPKTDTSLMTVARTSSKYCDDQAGNFTSVGNNVLCVTNKGALIEEARTTLVVNTLSMTCCTGAQSPNTAVASVTLPALFSGATILKHTRDTGTADTNVGAVGNITGWALSTGYVGSAWVYIPTNPNITSVALSQEQGTAPWSNTSLGTADLTKRDRWQRIAGVFSSGVSGTANPNMVLRIVATTGDFIYSTGWQFEAGSFPTSFIGSGGAAATRAADVVTVTTPPSFGSAYTLFAQGTPIAPTGFGTHQTFAQIDNGSNSFFSIFRLAGSGLTQCAWFSAGVGNSAGPNVWNAGASGKAACAGAAADQALSFNGGAITAQAIVGAIAPTRVLIGVNSTVQQVNGYLERIALWPTTRLPNATLQSLTQ